MATATLLDLRNYVILLSEATTMKKILLVCVENVGKSGTEAVAKR